MGSRCLPEDVIGHIISFLPTKYAVGTSILSKSMTQLWHSSITNLDFDDNLFIYPHLPRRSDNSSFVKFVNRVLLLVVQLHKSNNQQFNKFRLASARYYDPMNLNAWFYAALHLGVKEIDFSYPYRSGVYHLTLSPPASLASNRLVVLKLRGCVFVSSTYTCLVSLKSLHLDSVTFLNNESMLKLFSVCCPILEDLCLLRCYWEAEANVLSIASPSLKYLRIDTRQKLHRPAKIVFHTPNLKSFNFYGYLSKYGYEMTNLQSLVEAEIRIMEEEETSHPWGLLWQLLNGISNVRKLSLSCITLMCLQSFPDGLPTFQELSYLNLEPGVTVRWKLVKHFLRCSPRLSCLALYNEPYYLDRGARWLRELRLRVHYYIHQQS